MDGTLSNVPIAARIVPIAVERLQNRNQVKKGSYAKEVAIFAINGSIKSAAWKYDIPVTTVRGFVKSYKQKKAKILAE